MMLQFHRAFGPATAAMVWPSRLVAAPAEKCILVTFTLRSRDKFFNQLHALYLYPRRAHVGRNKMVPHKMHSFDAGINSDPHMMRIHFVVGYSPN